MVAAMKSRLFSKCQKPVGVHRIRMLSDNMGGSMLELNLFDSISWEVDAMTIYIGNIKKCFCEACLCQSQRSCCFSSVCNVNLSFYQGL